MEFTSKLEQYTYLDLEVDQADQIHCLGLVSAAQEQKIIQVESAEKDLNLLRNSGSSICGHNFRRFDYLHLIKRFPILLPWLVIDTLELPILAFPLARSHKLNKDYKLSEYAGNDPLEDALATRSLLENLISTLNTKPRKLLDTYAYLLSCGDDQASQAYRGLFADGYNSIPTLENLPPEAIA
ncbi:MAG: hypothetical protein SFT94_00860, partial [Pseudanabaenaceae cyanobacterium bins.68]|nr:hypothetical protein [Pseudanabaenaceae cyanobacterium bins.68]